MAVNLMDGEGMITKTSEIAEKIHPNQGPQRRKQKKFSTGGETMYTLRET